MNQAQSAPIYLPPPSVTGGMSLDEAIARRRSIRSFDTEPVSLTQLSQILWAAQGITDSSSKLRSVPSGGAAYPLEIFAACGNNGVEGIKAGVYRYQVDGHALTIHQPVDVKYELAKAAWYQEYILQAPVGIIICALYNRTTATYESRGERYVYVEVGHVGQNIYLQATALGLGTVAIGAFSDEQIRTILQLDEQYTPIYIMPLGKPSRR